MHHVSFVYETIYLQLYKIWVPNNALYINMSNNNNINYYF